MSIHSIGRLRRVGHAHLALIGALALGIIGLVDEAGAQGATAAIITKTIDLDRLVDAGAVDEAMCEPSAAVVAPWDQGVVLVGDNEVKKQLYAFTLTAGGPQFVEALDIQGGGKRPDDIEALVGLADSVLIVGSHSRNSSCEKKDDRKRMEWVRRASDGELKAVDFINSRKELEQALESEADCLETLFVDPPPPRAEAVCKALVAAEKAADDGAPPCACTSLNIEGAVALPDDRIWLGLRAPLADRKAIMLRLIPEHDELRFDRAVLVDLGNRGIRELSYDPTRRRIWGLAGPDIDRADPFRLWHLPLEALAGGDDLVGIKDDRELPTSSEALVVREGRALVLVDGDQGKGNAGKTCAVHPQVYELALAP